MSRLKELDLNNTQVTDAGLKVLKDLPVLRTLRLKNTKVTDRGFHDTLAGKESLMQLDLTGTGSAVKRSRPGRRPRPADGRC